MKCKHTAWVELVDENPKPVLYYGNRLAEVVGELRHPSEQSPHTVLLMGRDLKKEALRHLCPNAEGSASQATVALHVDRRTIRAEHPRLFADCDPTNRRLKPALEAVPACHAQQNLSVDWPSDESPHSVILSRLLFLFVDVICIFADDIGGLDVVEDLLSTWARIGSSSTLHHQTRPRVMVIVGGRTVSATQSLIDEQDFLFHLIRPEMPHLFDTFADIQTFRLLPSDDRFNQLERDLSSQLQTAQLWRERKRVDFNAIHLERLFQEALQHVGDGILLPFDYVQKSRCRNPLNGDFSSHLKTFLSLERRTSLPYEGLISHIASAIFMDAYPPDMHAFSPELVFQVLYQEPCERAIRGTFSTEEFASYLLKGIQSELGVFFRSMQANKLESSEIHQHTLRMHRKYWTQAQSNSTCLTCLRRAPEHVYPCGHSVCDMCVQIFGDLLAEEVEGLYLTHCLLCENEADILVKIKPATASIRVLCIDGGGTRGVMPLEILVILQELVGDDVPLYDIFDLGVGTSSGGLTVIEHILFRRSPKVCKMIFQNLSSRLFADKCRGLTGKIKRLWTQDSIYGAKKYDHILREHYRPDLKLFGPSPTGRSGGKVAVTMASSKDSTTFVCTNYNGTAHRCSNLSYGRLRPRFEYEPFLWEVGRGTSAVPGLFPAVEISGVGSFHDGGMKRHNNPINIAVSEARHLSYESIEPDVVLSLGTGSSPVHSPTVSFFRNTWKDGFLSRVYNSFMSSFDGEQTWKELWGVLDSRSRKSFVRINPPFLGDQPAMDDPMTMAELSKWVRIQASHSKEIKSVAVALLTSFFYFELDCSPVYSLGLYVCKGTIRCHGPAHSIIRALADLQPGPQEFYKNKVNLGVVLSESDICATCHRYTRAVQFCVRDLSDEISLLLRFRENCRNISSFPTTMESIGERQGIYDVFGRQNHGRKHYFDCDVCKTKARRGTKRKR